MSDTAAPNRPASPADANAPSAPLPTAAGRRRRPAPARLATSAAAVVILAVAPFYLDAFWLRAGFLICAAAVGALGLNLLVGTAGQLSLAHSFFLGVGAVTYTAVSGSPGTANETVSGLAWPPAVGLVAAVLASGLAGLLFSPIAARLRGIYLGVASLSLVFIGLHILNTWVSVTGGFYGRPVPAFSLFGFGFGDTPPLFIAGVPFEGPERLWYLGFALLACAYMFARNVIRGRPGRALQTIRDSEIAASVMGVNVQGYKARIFAVSSMYAGLAGVMLALAVGSISPSSFGLDVAVQYLAMIVLGGLASPGGAIAGGAFVAALPFLLQQYAAALPFISQPGEGGLTASLAARLVFGLAIVAVILYQPAGLAGAVARAAEAVRARSARRIATTNRRTA